MTTEQKSIEKMTVKELRAALETEYGYSKEDLNTMKKPQLVGLLEGELVPEISDFSPDNDVLAHVPPEDTSSVNSEAEKAEDVNDVEEKLSPPTINDLEWSDYVVSLMEYGELVNGNPTVDGLRRIVGVVLGDIVESHTNIVQVPTKENMGRASVTHTIKVLCGSGLQVSVTGSADSWYKNTDMPYSKFPVSMAETRAEGRALRRLLKLKVVAAEELSQVAQDDAEHYANQLVNENQINFIDVLCKNTGRGLDINIKNLLSHIGSKAYNSIREVEYDVASDAIKSLSEWQQSTDSIPEEIKIYNVNWRLEFDASNS